jgi:hypothetical protein
MRSYPAENPSSSHCTGVCHRIEPKKCDLITVTAQLGEIYHADLGEKHAIGCTSSSGAVRGGRRYGLRGGGLLSGE